ncbi:DoxX family protein [Rhodoplanes roseus]|uniref:DoxX family protein n=1 Tax=Rhodoplanes roseus TaxID=29409 RepID=A0A327KM85_9BRAD|nr:DoxX family protein [Rhodoplanes roseus]RAI38565.1 DoxX family protein [Rhodoplanes roseus]
MTDATLHRPAASPGVAAVRTITTALERIPYSLVALVARLSIAGVFWRSGQTKLDGWRLSDTAVELFRDEYRLPLVDPALAAGAAAIAEHLFPVLLVLGLATRFSALALLIMTLVIEILVYPDAWPTHGTWAACLLILTTRGAGVVSLDHLLGRRFELGTSA